MLKKEQKYLEDLLKTNIEVVESRIENLKNVEKEHRFYAEMQTSLVHAQSKLELAKSILKKIEEGKL